MPGDLDDQRRFTDRDKFLTDLDGLDHVDADIARSWRRSLETLGDPSSVADVPHVAEELLDAHLLDMFQAPLTRFSDSLDGTGLAVLLADSDGQILQRWCSDRTSANHLDRIGTTRGAVLSEGARRALAGLRRVTMGDGRQPADRRRLHRTLTRTHPVVRRRGGAGASARRRRGPGGSWRTPSPCRR